MNTVICRWFNGKKAALSFRFDDSHPTHILKAVPMLNEHGLVGTFLVNPARPAYEEYRETWEKTVLEQGHELGDHTLNHRGATTDRDSETQIGDCARHIRSIQPDNRPLAFQRGGATVWLQRKPFDFFLAKYDLFEPGRSMSCSEAYPQFSFDAFQKRLDAALENGEWMETHFHGIDETHLYISTDVFRRMLEHTAQHSADIWQTGMASAHCYQEERDGAHLFGRPNGNDAVTLHLTCATDPVRYNHPLTLELELPAGTKETTVLDAAGNSTNFQIDSSGKKQILRFNVPPETSDHTVRASGIGAAWQAANGPEWPDPGPHPYVFFTDDELPELRNKTKQAPASAMWENVKNAADHLLNEPAAPPDDPTWQDARDASNRLRILSFVHAITEDKAYALRAELEIDTILAAKSWNHLLIKADADLVSAEITCSLGLAWDWMHSALEQDRLRVIRDTIVTRGLEPIAKAAEDRVWWSYWMRGNWGAVIFGQAGVAALSILNEEPRAAEWLRLCRRKIWLYTQSLGTDGSWGESVSYACYAWSNATLLIDALHRFTGGKINLFDNLGLRRLPEWFIHLLTPDGSGFVPFSNCGKGVSFRGQYLYRLAREYGNPQAQWIAKHMAAEAPAADLFGFLWLDPDLAPEPPSSLPLAKIFSHTHWAVLRSRWNDPNATLFALKGGQKDWDHYHHDINHFVLYANGKPLITDLFYPHQIWGCETEAHNTVKVNEKDQRGKVRLQGCRGEPNHQGVIGDLVHVPWYTRMVGDGSLAYEPEDVHSFLREVLYLRPVRETDPPETFILFDDIDATAPVPLDWYLHTYGDLAVDRNTVTITQDDAAVDATVLAPERFTHTVHKKPLEEAGGPTPFDGATDVTFLKLRPKEIVPHGFFLTVLVPRKKPAAPPCTITPAHGNNTLGARIAYAAGEDIAVFTLEGSEGQSTGISLTGRSCLLRRTGERLTAATLHNGKSLFMNNSLLFETNGCGHAVLEFSSTEITAILDLYGCTEIRLRAPAQPSSATVDGEDRPFEYDPNTETVRLDFTRGTEVRLQFQS